MNKLFGYFMTAHSEKPEYDPGLNVPCLFCQNPLSNPMKSISIMREGSFRSWFYRCHKDCYDNLDSEEVAKYEEAITLMCLMCDGSGRREDAQDREVECIHCDGTGREFNPQPQEPYGH